MSAVLLDIRGKAVIQVLVPVAFFEPIHHMEFQAVALRFLEPFVHFERIVAGLVKMYDMFAQAVEHLVFHVEVALFDFLNGHNLARLLAFDFGNQRSDSSRIALVNALEQVFSELVDGPHLRLLIGNQALFEFFLARIVGRGAIRLCKEGFLERIQVVGKSRSRNDGCKKECSNNLVHYNPSGETSPFDSWALNSASARLMAPRSE